MKKRIIFLVFTIAILSITGIAQQRGPGDPGGTPEGNNPIGGGAPVGGGMGILIGLSVVYLGKKIYTITKIELEE